MDPDRLTPPRVVPGDAPRLAHRDARDTLDLRDKAHGHEVRDDLLDELPKLHARLWAEDERALLLILQGMDTAGKDGTIRRVFSGVNPQGVRVAGFTAPSDDELDRDYLWRVHQVVPRRRELGIFNRPHYEDVGVVRDRRWVRHAVVAQLLVATLRAMDPQIPAADPDLDGVAVT